MKSKSTKLSKGAYKSMFCKNNIYEKVLPSLQSALCSIILANYLGIIKKFARKQFSCYLCLLYFSNKLITFFESTFDFILNVLLPLPTIKGWKVSWIKVWTFPEKVKNQFSQSFLPLLCDRYWIENCIGNHKIE